jgi:group II intron reverse transcriptase/maturase
VNAVQKAENRGKSGCPCEGRLETESVRGAQSGVSLQRCDEDGAESLLVKVLDRSNLNRAYKRVRDNGGAPGIDGMTTDELFKYLKEHGVELIASISLGKYRPQPVRRVEIPKPDGGKRQLGIPTVVDRVIQLAIAQVLEPIFEPEFSDGSYGFRPGRSAHQAIRKARKYYDEGYNRVVDIDLAKYFDTINHDLLINMLREKVKDEKLLSLIRKCLKSGVMFNGVRNRTDKGSTQGSPLSPLLSNIYLTKFDRMLEARGHKFVRYADDCNIYVKSLRAGVRVMSGCTRYLERVLKLKVNQEKSAIGSPLRLKFLGFSLYRGKNGTRIRAHAKSLNRFKAKLKYITRRNRGISVGTVLNNLKSYVRGWLGYYAIADMSTSMKELTEWVRRRIRMYIWKQWKRIRTRFSNLKKLGVGEGQAWQWANTRKGYWRISGSWILTTTLTNERLANLGFDNFSKRYEALHSSY